MVVFKFSLLSFFPHSFLFHNIYQVPLIYQSCSVAPFLPFIETFIETKFIIFITKYYCYTVNCIILIVSVLVDNMLKGGAKMYLNRKENEKLIV
jgi:hypothetical protein